MTVKWRLIELLMAVLALIPGHRSEDEEKAIKVSLGPLVVEWDGILDQYEFLSVSWGSHELVWAFLSHRS